MKNAKISVRRQVQWDEETTAWYFCAPKYDSYRDIEIDDDLVELLRREKDRQDRARKYYSERFVKLYENEKRIINSNGDGKLIHPVCIRENGKFISPRNMQHTSSIIHKRLNFPEFDMHSFRKTHGSMLDEVGAPAKYIQYRLGHKNITVTLKHYVEKTEGMVKQGVEKMKLLFMKGKKQE